MSTLRSLFVPAVLSLFWSTHAAADPCTVPSVFSDVPDAATFCTNTQWLKNRAVTLGCGDGSAYCPDQAVTRAQMALFMNRLGTVLSPVIVSASYENNSAPGGGTDYCTTGIAQAVPYPRVASLTGFIQLENASTQSAVSTAIKVTEGGTPNYVRLKQSYVSSGGAWFVPFQFRYDIPANKSEQFAIVFGDAGGATYHVSCDFVATIYNRNSGTPPY